MKLHQPSYFLNEGPLSRFNRKLGLLNKKLQRNKGNKSLNSEPTVDMESGWNQIQTTLVWGESTMYYATAVLSVSAVPCKSLLQSSTRRITIAVQIFKLSVSDWTEMFLINYNVFSYIPHSPAWCVETGNPALEQHSFVGNILQLPQCQVHTCHL